MNATSVRVDEATKRELDRLQARLTLRSGAKLSHNEVLARLLAFVREREAEFLESGTWRPLTREEWKVYRRLGVDSGVESSAADIDDVLYGGASP